MEFYEEVCRRTAQLVAGWQCIGFCHGGAFSTSAFKKGSTHVEASWLPVSQNPRMLWLVQTMEDAATQGPFASRARFLIALTTTMQKLILQGHDAPVTPAGVLNTDNMSILGLTVDYGPYGFMDRYALALGHKETALQSGSKGCTETWNITRVSLTVAEAQSNILQV